VDKKGKVNKYMLFRLMNLEIKHEKWIKAIQLIRESQSVVGSRQYISMRTRNGNNEKYKTINLNFSSLS